MLNILLEGWCIVIITVLLDFLANCFIVEHKLYAVEESNPEVGSCNVKEIHHEDKLI